MLTRVFAATELVIKALPPMTAFSPNTNEMVTRFLMPLNWPFMLREIGVKGQKRIKAAKVVVAGAGALGSPVIQYLAAAGVGTIKVIDFDEVSLENLQSQVLHGTRDIKRPKVASAKDKVKNINKNIELVAEKVKLDSSNILEEIDGYDLVVDCSDNYKARYLINDACALHGIPVVFGAIYQFEGQVSVFNLDGGPCYRCQSSRHTLLGQATFIRKKCSPPEP